MQRMAPDLQVSSLNLRYEVRCCDIAIGYCQTLTCLSRFKRIVMGGSELDSREMSIMASEAARDTRHVSLPL